MSGDAQTKPARVLLGRIGSAHGIKGSVRIATYTGDPLAIAGYGPLETNRPGLTVTIADAKMMKATVIARLKGVTDRNTAETLNGVELYIDRDKLPEPEDEDDFYVADLIGLDARLEDGTVIGKVLAIPNYGAGDLIEIGEGGSSELLPFTKAVVPVISVKDGYLVIVPPDFVEADDAEDNEQEDGDEAAS